MKSMSRKALFTSLSLIVIGFVTLCSAQAADFCVDSSAGLYNALQTAASNSEDDVIRIGQGTYHGSFFYVSTEINSV